MSMSRVTQHTQHTVQSRFATRYFYIAALIVLFATNVGTVWYALENKKTNLDVLKNEYPLIDPSRHLIAQEHFISTLQPLREYMQDIVAREAPGAMSIYFEYLNTGANISVNQDLRVVPASLVKVPLALAVMKKVERGDWKLSNELVVTKEDRDYAWGDVHKHAIGTRITIEDLLQEMLVNSDNTAFRIFYRNLSLDELQDVLKAIGLDELFNEDGKITAKEYTRLFRTLYVSSYLNREHSQKLLDILSRTPYDEYLGQGIPEHVPFAHKIGENDEAGVVLDSGIVYIENRPYLVAVMIDYKRAGMNRDEALSIFKDLSEHMYSYIATYEGH